jgi:hypothetical protein
MSEFDPVFYDETTDVGRLNQLFDELTEKRFISVNVFVGAVRAALDLHGITLPHLDVEGADGYDSAGATVEDGKFVQAGITDGANVNMYAPPVDGEWIFNIKNGSDETADSDVYLYMIADRDDEGVFECYVQLVNGDEVDDLTGTENLDNDYPELVGDIAGETEWLAQQRHVKDIDEAPPGA